MTIPGEISFKPKDKGTGRTRQVRRVVELWSKAKSTHSSAEAESLYRTANEIIAKHGLTAEELSKHVEQKAASKARCRVGEMNEEFVILSPICQWLFGVTIYRTGEIFGFLGVNAEAATRVYLHLQNLVRIAFAELDKPKPPAPRRPAQRLGLDNAFFDPYSFIHESMLNDIFSFEPQFTRDEKWMSFLRGVYSGLLFCFGEAGRETCALTIGTAAEPASSLPPDLEIGKAIKSRLQKLLGARICEKSRRRGYEQGIKFYREVLRPAPHILPAKSSTRDAALPQGARPWKT